MIFLSIGLPGSFSDCYDRTILYLARQSIGAIEIAALNNLDEVARQLLCTQASHLIVASRQPNAQLRQILAEDEIPFIFFHGDARASVADLVMVGGYDLISAIRLVSSSCSALLRCRDFFGALSITPKAQPSNLTTHLEAICSHLKIPIDSSFNEQITEIASVAEGYSVNFDNWWSTLPENERLLVNGALEGYRDSFDTGTLRPFRWGGEFFFIGDDPSQMAGRSIDITGGARCLLFGPFIVIPAGEWRVNIVLGCSNEAAKNDFRIELFAGISLTQSSWCPTDGGMYEISLDFSLPVESEAIDHPFQIRIFNERSVLGGLLKIGPVSLQLRV